MKREVKQLPLFADNQLPPPIPDCAAALTDSECPTPADVVLRMVRLVRKWQREHPGRDWQDIVPPEWREYISWQLN